MRLACLALAALALLLVPFVAGAAPKKVVLLFTGDNGGEDRPLWLNATTRLAVWPDERRRLTRSARRACRCWCWTRATRSSRSHAGG